MAQVRLYNLTTGKKYKITALESFVIEKKTDATRLNLPELSEEEQDIVKMFGVQMDVDVVFKIVDDGTDKSEGTAASAIVTVWDQIDYLLDNFLTPSMDDNYKIEIFDGATTIWSKEGIVISIVINLRKAETAFDCNLRFLVGSVI